MKAQLSLSHFCLTSGRLLPCCLLAFCLLAACKGERPSGTLAEQATPPAIFPDYREVTVPVNLAPLHFRVEAADGPCYAEVTGSLGGRIEGFGTRQVRFDPKEWHRLLEQNADGDLQVTVYARREGMWQSWQPFAIHVSPDLLDSHLAYRLIEPGYEKWHIIGLYQRDLTSFDEQLIIRNDMVGNNCINCHSFCGGDPQQMMFHMRAENGGTYILRDEKLEKLNTKTPGTISSMTYPYWHPTGRYITTSVNEIKQFFHAVKEKKMEVFDLASDIVVYDVEKREIIPAASLITTDAFETFPTFSPDGRCIYFCSAPAAKMPEQYADVRYNLCRVAFDPDRGEIRMPIDTLVRADSLSASFPRISPDGRFLMYTETAYGQFPIWHKDAEIRMIDLQSGSYVDMSALNSDDTESYHSWSRNSRWVVVSSRRDDGLFTRPYFCHIAPDGTPSKPFLLPQEDPDYNDRLLYSFNLPELITGEITVSPYTIEHVAKNEPPIQVGLRK